MENSKNHVGNLIFYVGNYKNQMVNCEYHL